MTEFQKPNLEALSRPLESPEGLGDRDYGNNLIGFAGPMSIGTGRIIAIGLEAADKRLFFDPAIRTLTRDHDAIYPFFVRVPEASHAHLFAVAWDIGVSRFERVFGRAFSSLDGFKESPVGKLDELAMTEKIARGYSTALSYMRQWEDRAASLIRLGESKEQWLIETDGGVLNFNYSKHAQFAELGPLEQAGIFVAALSTRESKAVSYNMRSIPHTALSVRRTLPGEIDRLTFFLREGGSEGLEIVKREAETLAPWGSPGAASKYLAYLFLANQVNQDRLQRDPSPWKLAAIRENIGMLSYPAPAHSVLGLKDYACRVNQKQLFENLIALARMNNLLSAHERRTIESFDGSYAHDTSSII